MLDLTYGHLVKGSESAARERLDALVSREHNQQVGGTMAREHGYLEGPMWVRTNRFSLRRKPWYRWHRPAGNGYLDVPVDYDYEDFDLAPEEWESLNHLMESGRPKAARDKRGTRVTVAVILAGGLIGFWLAHGWEGTLVGLSVGWVAAWVLLGILAGRQSAKLRKTGGSRSGE